MRHFAFHLLPPFTAQQRENLGTWAGAVGLDYIVFNSRDTLVLALCKSRGGNLTLPRGAGTIRDRLGLPYTPTRIFCGKPFIANLLRDHGDGQVPQPICCEGRSFDQEALHRGLTQASRVLDMCTPLIQLVESGDVRLLDIPTIHHARDIVSTEESDRLFDERPDLDGSVHMTFRLYDDEGMPSAPDDAPPHEGGPTTVEIVGIPGSSEVKKKHYWLYSKKGNFGKTYTITTELISRYKAIFLSDANNATRLPKSAQFIVFDEAGPSNKLPIQQMKALTSGNASVSAINRKSYGESYVPRSDAQFIILTNHSPYDTYATTNPKTRLRRVRPDVLEPLQRRFNIIRLDGSDRDEMLKYVDPIDLTEEDYRHLLKKTFYDSLRLANSVGDVSTRLVRQVLAQLMHIHRHRAGETAMTTTLTLARDLQKAIPPVDYIAILDILDRFCTVDNIPIEGLQHLEYAVQIRCDEERNLYAEMVEGMWHLPDMLPTFRRQHELTGTGPRSVRGPARKARLEGLRDLIALHRRQDAAAERMRRRQEDARVIIAPQPDDPALFESLAHGSDAVGAGDDGFDEGDSHSPVHRRQEAARVIVAPQPNDPALSESLRIPVHITRMPNNGDLAAARD